MGVTLWISGGSTAHSIEYIVQWYVFKVCAETLATELPSYPVLLGEGLAFSPSSKSPWVVVVPFVLPGEVIQARVYRNAKMHSFADLISIEVPNSELRDMSRVKCKYFGTCAGCQYQVRPLPHDRGALRCVCRCCLTTRSLISSATLS